MSLGGTANPSPTCVTFKRCGDKAKPDGLLDQPTRFR